MPHPVLYSDYCLPPCNAVQAVYPKDGVSTATLTAGLASIKEWTT